MPGAYVDGVVWPAAQHLQIPHILIGHSVDYLDTGILIAIYVWPELLG